MPSSRFGLKHSLSRWGDIGTQCWPGRAVQMEKQEQVYVQSNPVFLWSTKCWPLILLDMSMRIEGDKTSTAFLLVNKIRPCEHIG